MKEHHIDGLPEWAKTYEGDDYRLTLMRQEDTAEPLDGHEFFRSAADPLVDQPDMAVMPSMALCSVVGKGVWHVVLDGSWSLDRLTERLPDILKAHDLDEFYWVLYLAEVTGTQDGGETKHRAAVSIAASGNDWTLDLFPFEVVGDQIFYGEPGAAWPPYQDLLNQMGGLKWHNSP